MLASDGQRYEAIRVLNTVELPSWSGIVRLKLIDEKIAFCSMNGSSIDWALQPAQP